MKTTIYFLLTILLFSGCISQKKFDELKSQEMSCAEALEKANGQIASIQAQVEELSTQNMAYSSQISEHEEAMVILQDEVVGMSELSMQNAAYAADIDQMESVIVDKDMEIGAMTENFKTIVEAVSPGMSVNISSSDMVQSNGQFVEGVTESARRNRERRIRTLIDTVQSSQYKLSEGNIALYCPKKMTFKRSYDVMSIIADLISEDEIRNTLLTQIKRHEPDITEAQLSDESFLEKVEYYNLVELQLESGTKDGFEINQIHENGVQKIQKGMEGWHWKVTPISEEQNQQLIVKGIFFDTNGSREGGFTRTFKVDVEVEMTRFFHTAKLLIINDPGWAIVTLIIPFLTFLWGYFIKNKKVQKIVSGEES